ncbi:iron chelate uptake ABC transporter family permease subunit [Gordonia sp. (in: high G+C Gram-positive bacteria)]|uniref:FecCD family ABC transporter permease n=1 Tax=Gordonia sp. (in: high G+C Gram-positive bacteria) TaxID=84139 RepID=UPI00169D9B00|nr:iron chelate uptake ABC transporter family permease subunit [Gordonia sp. (in: high G+C Gram-positive bacteria)]NLG47901.1 iron chelate uptake ABC transporter family permease subunit [Gordonia sp. (in: high G+C Gram-positive bacteria)]
MRRRVRPGSERSRRSARSISIAAFTVRVSGRSTAVAVAMVAVLLGTAYLSLSLGRSGLEVADLLALVSGNASPRDQLILGWRAPRALAAVVFGACLGISGAFFQSLTGNALGSPDVIGLSSGAYTGVIVVLMVGGSGFLQVALGAVIGCTVAAVAVFLLAYKQGLAGFRLIVVGIAVSATLTSFNHWFSVSADLDEAMRAAIWGAGSLAGIRWGPLAAVVAVALVLTTMLPPIAHRMRQLELGEDTAAALGVEVERTKLAMVLIGVVFTAVVTAVAGPIAFVALAAPQIAKRLCRSPSLSLTSSALVGAAVLSTADIVAVHLLADARPPVGVVTVTLGGLYLVWLLLREAEK